MDTEASSYIKSSLAAHPVRVDHVHMLNKGNAELMMVEETTIPKKTYGFEFLALNIGISVA